MRSVLFVSVAYKRLARPFVQRVDPNIQQSRRDKQAIMCTEVIPQNSAPKEKVKYRGTT